MADEENKPDEAAEGEGDAGKKKKGGSMITGIIWGVMGMLLGAGGFSVPMMFPQLFGGEPAKPEPVVTEPAFVEFGEAVVTLNEDRLGHYLRAKITLQVDATELAEVEQEITAKHAILKNWLISYLSDLTLDDIRGAAGQARLRREIQNHFNSTLFKDGYDRIHDVLFVDFSAQ
ncbi:MAG: flagellar basal body-associated FliL family protein [Planctomycetales bacterium]|nr:flagellar basal body-associated FliL family protein [Planctomycetales bacterium]